MSASLPVVPAVVEWAHAALCLDCERVFDGDAAHGSCPRCASEALLWLQPVLDRQPERRGC